MQEDTFSNPRCPKISFTEEEVRSFYKPKSKALVIKVLEKKFSFQTVKRRLETIWARSGNIQVSDAANSFFLVRFSDQDDYQRAAFRGPWKIYDYYISVARWTPQFNEEEPLEKILTWVRLPRLPIHYFNQLAVTRIGNHIGRTVRLDLATTEGARGRFARVCVEIDISKPLIGKYMIEDRTFLVEYESLENICHHCGIYGHKIDNCSEKVAPPSGLEFEATPETIIPDKPEEVAGSWMTVRRRNKGKPGVEKSAANNSKTSGSRFTILQQDEARPNPHREGWAAPGTAKAANPSAVKLATDLAAVLQEASVEPRTDKPSVHPPVTEQVVRDPLSDISNVSKTKKQGKGVGRAKVASEEAKDLYNFINIPVTYANPIFQGTPTIPGTKIGPKSKPKRVSNPSMSRIADSATNTVKKDGKQTRTFSPKSTKESATSEGQKGDPPDAI
ncbi:hypothetical protein LINPERHAP2_LOCUS45359 [Linum perenne]